MLIFEGLDSKGDQIVTVGGEHTQVELLKEYWEVVEDDVSRAASTSGLPMFGDAFHQDR